MPFECKPCVARSTLQPASVPYVHERPWGTGASTGKRLFTNLALPPQEKSRREIATSRQLSPVTAGFSFWLDASAGAFHHEEPKLSAFRFSPSSICGLRELGGIWR